MALATPTINGADIQRYAVVFGLYPGDPTFHTIVERAPDVGGSPGTPTEVATLAPGVRTFVEEFGSDGSFMFYRFFHRGFAFDAGTPTAWFKARPVEWNGEIPNLPREALLDLDLALDDADGTVDLVANGGRRVKSIEWDFSTTAFPTEPATVANTDAEGDVTVTDAFTLTRGQTGYVTVQFFDQASGAGNLLGTLRASVVRAVDTKPSPVAIEELITYDGAGNGSLELLIDDPDGRLQTPVVFRTKSGLDPFSADINDSVAPWGPISVALSEKHNSYIDYRVDYTDPSGGTSSIRGVVAFDVDTIPELTSIGADADDTGAVQLSYAGDDDVASIRYATSTSAYPDLATTQAGTSNDGRTGQVSLSTLTEGQTLFISVLAYDAASGAGTEGPVLYRTKATFRTDTEPDPETFPDLVLNGDFEHDTDGAYWGQGTSGASIETTSPLSGAKSLKLTSSTSASRYVNQTATKTGFGVGVGVRRIKVTPGEVLQVTATGKGQSNHLITLRFATYDSLKSQVSDPVMLDFAGSTETKTANWQVPSNIEYIAFQVLVGADASGPRDYFMDNISVRRLTPEPPTNAAKVLNGDFELGGLEYWAGNNISGWTIERETASPIGGTGSLKLTSAVAGGFVMRNVALPIHRTDGLPAKENFNLIEVEEGDLVIMGCAWSGSVNMSLKVNCYPEDKSGNLKHTFVSMSAASGTDYGKWTVPAGIKWIVPIIEGGDSSTNSTIIDNIFLKVVSVRDTLDTHGGGIARDSGRVNDEDKIKGLPKNFQTVTGLLDGDSVDFTAFGFDAPPKYAVSKYGFTYEPNSANWTGTFDANKAQRLIVDLVDVSATGATVRAVLQQPPTQSTETTPGSGFEAGSEDPMTAVGHNQRKAINNLPATNDEFTVRFGISATGGGDGGGTGGATYRWEVEVKSIGSNVVRAIHAFNLLVLPSGTESETAAVNITASDMTTDLADDIEIRVKSGPTYVSGNIKHILSSWDIDADATAFVTHQFATAPPEAKATDASLGAHVGFRIWDEA